MNIARTVSSGLYSVNKKGVIDDSNNVYNTYCLGKTYT